MSQTFIFVPIELAEIGWNASSRPGGDGGLAVIWVGNAQGAKNSGSRYKLDTPVRVLEGQATELMSVHNKRLDMQFPRGRHYAAIPGPSVIPDQVLQAMHRASPNIYDPVQWELQAGIQRDLKAVARTMHHVAMYIANGHGAWEAAVANVLSPGDRVLVLATGRFAHGWAAMARSLGVLPEVIDFGLQSPINLQAVAAALAADSAQQYKAVLACHVDTATSVLNDIPGLRRTLTDCGHPALLMIDCIASLGCDRFEMDAWGVDVMVAASQKGLMTPPGVGLVFFNERAAGIRRDKSQVSSYWDWTTRANPEELYQFFGGTSPTHHLFGLRAALDMLLDETVETVWQRHAMVAGAVHRAVEAWSVSGVLSLNVQDAVYRSNAVTAIRAGAPDGTRIRDWVEQRCGVTLGVGLGMADPADPAWHGFFRIGHMGHVNPQMILGVLGSVDAALKALDIPHGEGAMQSVSSHLSEMPHG
jgi:alanine-glyoxylate transaminase/serine-glyoxylate transaminase/serine-pyruvate transaminase